MKRLEDIKELNKQDERSDISKKFEKLMILIRRYNPRLYPSINPVKDYKATNNDDYDDAA